MLRVVCCVGFCAVVERGEVGEVSSGFGDYNLPYGFLGKIYDKFFLGKSMERYLETLKRMKRLVERLP